jgi:hypothetical protein
MSCQKRAGQVAGEAAAATGISGQASQSGSQAGQRANMRFYLPGQAAERPLSWPPPGGRGLWGDYRRQIKAALKAWRSQKDDRALAQIRAEIANGLAEQVLTAKWEDKRAGLAADLAKERAKLLLTPPKSVSVGERVERVAVLDNAIALLRLKRAINAQQYQAALVDTVCELRTQQRRSKAPVTWLPHRPVGSQAETASAVEPGRKLTARYRVVELDEPVVSNLAGGDINPEYDQTLQPRRRDRAASQVQIDTIATKLEAGELLKLGASWSDGPPLVGPDGLVESGNGRILALRRAVESNPAGYAVYRQQLTEQAMQYGLEGVAITKLERPLLVRERLTLLADTERRRFVTEANASGVSRMGLAEQARADAQLLPPGFFRELQVSDSDRSLAEVLVKKTNAPLVARFFKLLPETERAVLMDRRGRLSNEGSNRLERAMFAYSLPGPAGERLARLVFEEGEAIDRVGAGLRQALPKLGPMEDLIRAGQYRPELSLGHDLAVTIEKMWDIRQQGLSVNDYLRQYKMFPELTSLQEQLLAQLDARRRSGRAVAELLNAYADQVQQTAPPGQAELFGQDFRPSREELWRAAIKSANGDWLDLQQWSAAQRVLSGYDLPATKVQTLTPTQQAAGMKAAILG